MKIALNELALAKVQHTGMEAAIHWNDRRSNAAIAQMMEAS